MAHNSGSELKEEAEKISIQKEKEELESKLEEQKKRLEQQNSEKKELESKLEQTKRLEQHDVEKKELESKLEEQKKRLEQRVFKLAYHLWEQNEIFEQKLSNQQEEYETHKKQLSINNRCEVLEVTADVQVKCEELGRVLDLDRSVVSKISRDNPSILQRHYEIMKCWIKNSGASWKKLVHALRSQLLEEKEVAQEIAKKYLGVFHVGTDDLGKMKQRLRNLSIQGEQEAQGVIFVIGIYGPARTNVVVENISSTFNGLKFAVWCERDPVLI